MRDVRGGVRQCHLDDFDVLRPDVLLFFAERVRNLMVVCVNKRLAVGLCKKTHIQRLNLVIIGGVDAKVFGQASDCVSGTVGEVGRVQLVLLRQGPFEVLGARFFWDVRDFHLLHLFSNVSSSVLGFAVRNVVLVVSHASFEVFDAKVGVPHLGVRGRVGVVKHFSGSRLIAPERNAAELRLFFFVVFAAVECWNGVVQGSIFFIEKLESGVEG